MIEIRAFANAAETVIVWNSERIPGCIGFALQRKRIHPSGQQESRYVENRMAFQDEDVRQGECRPSDEWPFQQYFCVDHDVLLGDRVRYRVIPAFEDNEYKSISLSLDSASDWSDEVLLDSAAGGLECYFNRSFLLNQLVHQANKTGQSSRNTRRSARKSHQTNSGIRKFLCGDLGRKLLDVLDEVRRDRHKHLYAVIGEISDRKLAAKVEKIGERAHLVLSHGNTAKHGQDENSEIRKNLRKAGVEVHDRMLWSRGQARNNFMVVSDGENDPQLVWTGSANWTSSALCAQINYGLLIHNDEIARQFHQQWYRLKNAGSDFPEELMASNDLPKAGNGWTIWFTRTSDQSDLEYCRALIRRASQGIFFLLFGPGPQGLQNEILARKGQIYVNGVVNSLNQRNDSNKHCQNVNVQLLDVNESYHFNLAIMQPEGIHKDDLTWWAQQFTHSRSSDSRRRAYDSTILHSNVVVIDPFGTTPVVITGSHNMGALASEQNDENLLIVEDNHALAEKCMVHIASIYDHFRWRVHVLNQEDLDEGLRRDDRWQNVSRASREQMEFWLHRRVRGFFEHRT